MSRCRLFFLMEDLANFTPDVTLFMAHAPSKPPSCKKRRSCRPPPVPIHRHLAGDCLLFVCVCGLCAAMLKTSKIRLQHIYIYILYNIVLTNDSTNYLHWAFQSMETMTSGDISIRRYFLVLRKEILYPEGNMVPLI